MKPVKTVLSKEDEKRLLVAIVKRLSTNISSNWKDISPPVAIRFGYGAPYQARLDDFKIFLTSDYMGSGAWGMTASRHYELAIYNAHRKEVIKFCHRENLDMRKGSDFVPVKGSNYPIIKSLYEKVINSANRQEERRTSLEKLKVVLGV